MAIWSSEIKDLEKLSVSIKGQLPDLEKELERLLKTDDENIILVYSRRCLEVIITDLCECELKRPRKTEPLKGIIDKLNKEEKVPSNIITSMDHLNSLSAYGAHPKDFDPEQVKPVLVNLDIIIKWYLKYKNIKVNLKAWTEEIKDEIKIHDDSTGKIQKSDKKLILLISRIAIILILIVAGIFLYPKIFQGDRLEYLRSKGEISIAVMPFQNMTNDTTKNIWVDLIQHNLISNLSDNPEELKVRQIESVEGMLQSKGIINYSSFTPSLAHKISKKLDANVYIDGNIGQIGPMIRVIAYLRDSKTGEIYKPFQIEISSMDELNFQFIDVLSDQVKDFLLLTQMRRVVPGTNQAFINTESVEAFRCFTFGQKAYFKREFEVAIKHYNEALANDSNFFYPAIMISYGYGHLGIYDEAKKYCHIIYDKRDQMPILLRSFVNAMHARFFETPNERIKYFRDLLDIDNQSPIFHWNVGYDLKLLNQYDKAITEFEKAMDIYNNWDLKSRWVTEYTDLGFVYHKMSMYNKEKKLYKKAEKDYPSNPDLIYRMAILALSEGKTNAANEYIEKYKTIRRENSVSETDIATNLANIYWEAELLDKAEEYFREALKLSPNTTGKVNNLAWFLIDTERNINEGMALVDSILKSSPDNFNYLHTKGWELYKHGRYQEAKEVLQKSWDIRKEQAVYNHEAYLHLEAAIKAVVNEKRD